MIHYGYEHFMDDPSFQFRAFRGDVPETIDTHTHEFMELVFVKEGSGRHEISGYASELTEGDVYLVEPHVTHAYRVLPGKPVTVYNVIFDPSIIASELEMLNRETPFVDFFYLEPFIRRNRPFHPPFKLTGGNRVRACLMIESLMEEDSKRDLGYQVYIKTQLIQLLIFLSRCYASETRTQSLKSGEERETMTYICDFIARHYTLPLTLEQVSALSGMGVTAFSVKFKKWTGCTLIEYRNRLRLERAAEELERTDGKIIDIAMNAGFEDISHFNQMFKSETGMSPGAYRKRRKHQ